MGNCPIRFLRWAGAVNKEPFNVLLLGLDNAGKTTLLHRLHDERSFSQWIAPTFYIPQAECLLVSDCTITAFDVGGNPKMLPLYRCHFRKCHGIVFVVDSTDRLDEARTELHRILNEDGLSFKPLLVICNKQDLPNALPIGAVVDKLQLSKVNRQRRWRALCGDGLDQGLNWLCNTIREGKEQLGATEQSKETREIDWQNLKQSREENNSEGHTEDDVSDFEMLQLENSGPEILLDYEVVDADNF